ncbi:PQQ-binding-like beta-propeller repeat protein [Streptomyces sp. Tu6071]|uniref:outer membrane protein assembly factor BamB family protein n=1 Tax=Streptomyces sp. Tu6071 TaxID=355249 RepID=UPI0005B9D05A|nr:PQQ-binding-like beta-propeller repeat protein [Streptomyces sp. Tu6071]
MDQLTQHDPRRIGQFEVLGRLGAGGMGLVYMARSASGRRVAIKTVRAELAQDQLFRVRFTREVEAARAVSGFYTAAVVDADPRAAVPWLATAYVPAPSLEEIVNECGPLPANAVRWLAAGVAEALESIHGAGLVHRDLKPSNVLVMHDGPRVIDFGIASGVSNTRLTMTNVAVGTPAYMSPEQAKDSRSVTGASDIFSLGSTLVFAATGHAPFHGANPVETVFMLLREGPDTEGMPEELQPLIESCMGMEAAMRPSPADLQASLSPHLFAAGADDSGTASAWLPARAVALIESKSRTGMGPRQPAPPKPVPPSPPVPPRPAVEPAVPNQPGKHAAEPEVMLPGARVPVREGLRVAEARAAGQAERQAGHVALASRWTRESNRRAPVAAPPTTAATEPRPGVPGQPWRPWRFRMSNDVWGTPVLADDLVYVTSFEVHALDVATGRRRFKTRDVALVMAVDQGRIHASDGPGVHALDARTGNEIWRAAAPGWVYALSAGRGTVLTASRGGTVRGWDAASGERLWEAGGLQTDFETTEAAPVLHEGTAYLWQDARLRAVDARTGAERWSYPVGDVSACGGVPLRVTPAADGSVYVCAGTRVLAIEAHGGRVRWQFEAPAVFLSPPAFAPGPAVTGGGVYVADYHGAVWALDAEDGRDRWRIATEARSSVDPVLVAGGLVHVASGNGMYTLNAVHGTPAWRFQAGGDIVGAPVASGDLLHFGSADNCLYTLSASGGQLRWKLLTGGAVTGSPVVRGGVVYACSGDRCVYALDAKEGTGTQSAQGRG